MNKDSTTSESKNKVKKSAKKKNPKGSSPNKEDETDSPFNFGGLPDRELKKNLGCG